MKTKLRVRRKPVRVTAQTPITEMPTFSTVGEVCTVVGMHPNAVYMAIAQGKLKAAHWNSRVRIPRESLLEWLGVSA